MSSDRPGSTPLVRLRGLVRPIETILGTMAVWAHRSPYIALFLVVLSTAGAFAAARQLRVNPDLTELLPESFASVQNINKLKKRFGGIGYLAILVEDADPEVLRRFADDIALKLDSIEGVRYVDYRRPVEFFSDRALYYMALKDLQVIKQRLTERQQWEKVHANPLIDLLDEEKPPPIDFADLQEKYEGQLGHSGESPEPYYLDSERRMLAILIKPTGIASDLNFARRLVQKVDAVLAKVDLAEYDTGMKTTLAGRYKKRIDLKDLFQSELQLASVVALFLILVYLGFHFRRASSVVLLLVPLVVGLVWTYGFSAITIGTLNILTAFIGVMLLGIGIDNGIHILGRYEVERAAGASPEDSVRRAFGETGRASATAALTTTAGFASLAFSDFRAFREFGIIASGGLALLMLAYVVCLPALLGIRYRLNGKHQTRPRPNLMSAKIFLRWAPWVFWLALVGTFAATVHVPDVEFNYDFGALEAHELPSFRADILVNDLLGKSQSPMVVLTDNAQEAEQVAAHIRKRMKELGDASTIKNVATSADLVPKNQKQKQQVIHEIADIVDLIEVDDLTDEQRSRVEQLNRRIEVQPFTYDDLPAEAKRTFRERPGTKRGEFVLTYPRISVNDGTAVRQYAAELRSIPIGEPGEDGVQRTVAAAGFMMVLADVLDSVFRAAPRSIAIACIVIFLVLWLMLGRLSSALLSLLPAALTVVVTTGLMAAIGIKYDYLNIIIMPVLLGLGVDGGAHILSRLASGKSVIHTLQNTGYAVVGATTTTALGFLALLVTTQPALISLAYVALLGLAVNLLATIVFLPALLVLFARPANTGASAGANATAMFATVGNAGLATRAPGSLGALVALPFGWLMRDLSAEIWIAVLIALTLFSVWVVNRYLVGRDTEDPQEVVIDEFVGCLIVLAIAPWSLGWMIAGYALFRLFDIWKPGPIRILHRRLKGGLGVVADDVLAGLCAAGVLAALHMIV